MWPYMEWCLGGSVSTPISSCFDLQSCMHRLPTFRRSDSIVGTQSSLLDAKILPSELKETSKTSPRWPWRGRPLCWPVFMSQSRTVRVAPRGGEQSAARTNRDAPNCTGVPEEWPSPRRTARNVPYTQCRVPARAASTEPSGLNAKIGEYQWHR